MPAQLLQKGNTCWFYSILNCMLLSSLGRRLLLKYMKRFVKQLTPEQMELFKNKHLCVRATPKNQGFVFYKFIYSFWQGKLYKGKTKQLIENLRVPNPDAKIQYGGYVNIEREKMLATLKMPYSMVYTNKPEKTKIKPFSEMVVVCNYEVKKPIQVVDTRIKGKLQVNDIPLKLEGHPEFHLDHAILQIFGTVAEKNTPVSHVLSCIRLPNGEYRIVEPNGAQDPCLWIDPVSINMFIKTGWYKDTYDWDIHSWGFNSIVYIKVDSKLPPFIPTLENSRRDIQVHSPTPVRPVNKYGQPILMGPKGGRYVQYAVGKAYRPLRKFLGMTPKNTTNGVNSKGRAIYTGAKGGTYVILVNAKGQRYKKYLTEAKPVVIPKKKPIGTNVLGRNIYRGPHGGRFVIIEVANGTKIKKYLKG